jgi:ubiquinone/menaquinone biosynthesis C-methylase UbiE
MRHEPIFDRIADVYDSTRKVPDAILRSAFDWVRARTNLPGDAAVLDVGTGTGRVLGPLLASTSRLAAVDISRNMLKKLQEKMRRGRLVGEADLILADAHHLPLRNAQFEMMTAAHAMDFLEPKFCWEAKRVLRPGG